MKNLVLFIAAGAAAGACVGLISGLPTSTTDTAATGSTKFQLPSSVKAVVTALLPLGLQFIQSTGGLDDEPAGDVHDTAQQSEAAPEQSEVATAVATEVHPAGAGFAPTPA